MGDHRVTSYGQMAAHRSDIYSFGEADGRRTGVDHAGTGRTGGTDGHDMRPPELSAMYQQIVSSILRVAMEDVSLNEILLHALDSVLLYNRFNLVNKGAILLMAEDSDHLILCVHRGFDRRQAAACRRIPLGTCHCGRAALTGTMQYAGSVDHRHDIRAGRMVPHGHYCVPICAGEDMLGVLTLYLRHGHARSRDEKEMLWAISNILASVVKRKKTETALQRLVRKQELMITRISDEQKMTESIIRSIRGGLMVCGHNSKILKLNSSGRMILGRFLDRENPVPPDNTVFADHPLVRSMLRHNGQTASGPEEIRCHDRAGMERTLRYTTVALENSSGEQIGRILQFDDVTEMVRIGQEMKKMNKLSTVAEIASAVAHEIRNPLAGIKTMSQAIEENCDKDDENREYIRRIIRQVDRLNDLLNEFFTYATPGKAERETICLRRAVEEMRLLVRGKIERQRIALTEEYEQGLPEILVDPGQLHQVLLNLMLNAIDAVGSNGRIHISARRAGRKLQEQYAWPMPGPARETGYVAVSFRDNGCGMTPEVAKRAFEPFFTTRHHGTGLGLAIVQRILHENNAFIALETRAAAGTAFVMLFESAA
ncbi:MAG TPA: hypothetical protein ENI89_08215 [Desulfobulbus sp.]|nr:hypothetical protein [Desulfobulbus sp.]